MSTDIEKRWQDGYGVIAHEPSTRARVQELLTRLVASRRLASVAEGHEILAQADRLASAAMWLVVHATYAARVRLDGAPLSAEDFKVRPEGHTGGSLNMVPAYVGYLAANALTGQTRAWMMGQGHCVAAIDAVNILLGNLHPEQASRYRLSDEGLGQFVRDFYGYELGQGGHPAAPLGSHVNAHTAGGVIEGGYLGFAELLWVHAPLRDERLVVFLSDGAFEEQRGSDWAARWWRAEDSGLVAPIMIANGRRIDQRTTMAQQGGVAWLREHLVLNGFEPVDLDGRDPAAFAWATIELEDRLQARGAEVAAGRAAYPVRLPYAIAEAPKGFGFPGAGTNRAHNLPLAGNPHVDAGAREEFNQGARRLWVPRAELDAACATLTRGVGDRRPRERDHALATRHVAAPVVPPARWREPGELASPMAGVDATFVDLVRANPGLRPRVGNPDELRSNRLNGTLDLLRHRVTAPEAGIAEAVTGAVITALNEEAVVCAALGNKGGLNLVVTYEAFGVKMLGALRQEISFARQQEEVGRPAGWLGVPVLLTSHTWENGKNEQSHQDPTLAEALLGEPSDMARVAFPVDWNSALATLRAVYASRGKVWGLVVPKNDLPVRLSAAQAEAQIRDGAVALRADAEPELILCAVGAYQLAQAVRASDRLAEHGVAHQLVSLLEPGRFRAPRDALEAAHVTPPEVVARLFPASAHARVLVTHTRPEPLLGVLRPLDTGPITTRALGYANRGGTLDVFGMLYANRCTWAHVLLDAATVLGRDTGTWLTAAELASVQGEADPRRLDAKG